MAKDFDYKSGQYNVRLVLGDAAVSNPIDWHFVSLKSSFSGVRILVTHLYVLGRH